MEYEALQVKMGAEANGKDGDAKLEKFNTDKRPKLIWEMLVDLYNTGGQRGASQCMLALLDGNLADPQAITWVAELKALLSVEAGTGTGKMPGESVTTTPISVPAAPPVSPASMPEPASSTSVTLKPDTGLDPLDAMPAE